MAKIRSDSYNIPPVSHILTAGWQDGLSEKVSEQFCFFDLLEKHIQAFLSELYIHNKTLDDQRQALEYLDKLHNWVEKMPKLMREAKQDEKSSKKKLLTCLQRISRWLEIPERNSEKERAAHLALTYVEIKIYAILSRPQREGDNFMGPDSPEIVKPLRQFPIISQKKRMLDSAHYHLKNAYRNGGEIDTTLPNPEVLLRAVTSAQDWVKNIEAGQSGELVPEDKRHLKVYFGGKLQEFSPDPVSKKNVQSVKNVQRHFVTNLILLYEWAGGRPWLNKDNRESPFLLFLQGVSGALPSSARPTDSFRSLALEVLQNRKETA